MKWPLLCQFRRHNDFIRRLHVFRHECFRTLDAVGIARKGRNHRGVLGIHDEVLEQLGILDILRILENRHVVHPDHKAFLGIAIDHLVILQARTECRTVPVHAGGKIALGNLLDRAVVHRQPFGLGFHQLVAHLLEKFLVARAGFAAHIHDGQRHHVAHFRNHVDLAHQFRRRVKPDGRGVHVAAVETLEGVNARRAPLPRHL